MKKSQQYKKSWSQIERHKGTMRTLGGLVQLYGGWEWEPAIQGALRAAARCRLLGGNWVKDDEWSGLAHYLVLEKEFEDTFENKWTQLEDYFSKQQDGPAGTQTQGEYHERNNHNTNNNCCLLPAACCLLPAACCLLPDACCLLPAACCLLPAACC